MSNDEKIKIIESKVLKLTNVLIKEVDDNQLFDVNKIYFMMNSYIKSKGNFTIGPIINYCQIDHSDPSNPKSIVKIMVQLKNPMSTIDDPYEFKAELKVSNCLFARFSDKEENLPFAYKKLSVYAFENDLELTGDTYTVFVNSHDDKIVADIFMQYV